MKTPLRDRLARPLGWRGVAWRVGAAAGVFLLGFVALCSGVGVSERPAVAADGDVLSHAYYALGLFVLGGLDLGVPHGGPALARVALWLAYFLAPALTTSAVVEGLLRAMGPGRRRWRHRTDHVVVFGYGRLARLFIDRLRDEDMDVPVVVVDIDEHHTTALHELRARQRVYVMQGSLTDPGVLERVGAARARLVFLLTGDDFANLEGAAHLLALNPEAGAHTYVHVGDLGLFRTVAETGVGVKCAVFNRHEDAAHRLVQEHLVARFLETEATDTVVLAGFGRFGQTVLDQLQRHAASAIGRVVVVDLQAQRKEAAFARAVGFEPTHERETIEGDLSDQRLWDRIEAMVDGPLVVVAASGDDGLNLRLALAVKARRPDVFVVARTFHESRFATDVCLERGIEAFSVAELVESGLSFGGGKR